MAALGLAFAFGSSYEDISRPYHEECQDIRNHLNELHGMSFYVPKKSF